MNILPDIHTSASTETLHLILEDLGFGIEQQEQTPPADSYRLEFEQNFTVELQTQGSGNCRISARIFNLGKSLQVQEKQIRTALFVFSEVQEDLPLGISPAVSDHDNCLRLCLEIQGLDRKPVMQQFHDFVNFAFAFQQTCFRQN